MRYFLGLDGGQTKTLAVLVDESGNVLGIGRAGPSNHLNEPGAYERLSESISESILLACRAYGSVRLAAAFLGMASLDPRVSEIATALVTADILVVENDTVSAWAGATLCEPGVITISGTGSVSFGVNNNDERAMSAYWAHLFGDEGSGFDLGKRALRLAARASDGRGEQTVLQKMLLEYFGVVSMDEVRREIYSKELERHKIAQIARLLILAAQEGDMVSKRELELAGAQLAEGALAVLRRLKLMEVGCPVCPTGGVFQAAGELMKASYRDSILHHSPKSMVKDPEFPPVIGSAMMAMKEADLKLTAKVIGNLRQTYREQRH